MFDVAGYLSDKGIAFKQAGPEDVNTLCFFCNEESGKRGRLYINVDPNRDPDDPVAPLGAAYCHRCAWRGAIGKLRKHFGDPPLAAQERAPTPRVAAVCASAAEFYHEALSEHPEALRWWRDHRGFTIETIMDFKLGFGAEGLEAHLKDQGFTLEEIKAAGLIDQYGREFLRGCAILPYLSNGKAVLLRGRQMGESSDGKKYLTPPGQKGRLFNADITFTDITDVCLCEGELDALMLLQHGIPAVAMSGATAWQTTWATYFDEITKAYICFDQDEAGKRGAEKLATQLGSKARVINIPQEGGVKLDPAEWFKHKTVQQFKDLLKAQRHPLLITPSEARDEFVLLEGVEGLQLGIPTIDTQISPGLRPSQLLIMLAATGVGKTLWLINTFYRMSLVKPDLKILFVSLEQTKGEWYDRARRIHRFYNPNDKDERVLDFFGDRMMLVDKNRIKEHELVEVIDGFAEVVGARPDLVAVDYLGYWARSYDGEPSTRTAAAVMALKEIAKDQSVTIIAPHQVNRTAKRGERLTMNHSRDSGVVEETADFLMGLWSADSASGVPPEDMTGTISMDILKSRHGGAGTSATLQFAPLSLSMVPVTDTTLALAAEREYVWRRHDQSMEQVFYRHATEDDRSTIPSGDLDDWKRGLQ